MKGQDEDVVFGYATGDNVPEDNAIDDQPKP